MAGREKKQVYIYDIKGKFIEKFISVSECRRKYFPDDIGKRPMFRNQYRFKTFKYGLANIKYTYNNGFYFFEDVFYRDDVVFLHKIHNSEFCKKTDSDEKEVEVYNYLGEKIAEFKSLRLLTKMMPNLNQSGLTRELNNINKKTKRHTCDLGLFFKFKTQEQNPKETFYIKGVSDLS